jgi:hypothetical protein
MELSENQWNSQVPIAQIFSASAFALRRFDDLPVNAGSTFLSICRFKCEQLGFGLGEIAIGG